MSAAFSMQPDRGLPAVKMPIEAPVTPPVGLTAQHRRRLRQLWRSAGWPCQDGIELELLAAGLIERLRDDAGRETLRVTDAGVQLLAATLQRNRRAFDEHEALVARVVLAMQHGGRLAWRGLRLRAPPVAADGPRTWPIAMPDVFSIRPSTVEDYVEPIVHEVKVRRADLLADLRHEAKRTAYLGLASQCWYVLKAGIAEADEVPAACGVMVAQAQGLAVLRPAPRRAMRLPLATWMALARANAEPPPEDEAQAWLGDNVGGNEDDNAADGG
jgi:hypothetical protein